MQTFLPYPDYLSSLRCLDDSRLGNQVYREAKTLLLGGWKNHPASKMWRGYEYQLCLYIQAGLQALRERNRNYPHHELFVQDQLAQWPVTPAPPWLGHPGLHASHRSNLLRKDPVWYGQFGWTEPRNLLYIWPVE